MWMSVVGCSAVFIVFVSLNKNRSAICRLSKDELTFLDAHGLSHVFLSSGDECRTLSEPLHGFVSLIARNQLLETFS
jgi:hypothetical protein